MDHNLIMSSRYDEWLAYCRDWMAKQPVDDLTKYAMMLVDEIAQGDKPGSNNCLTCHFAMLGFSAALLSLIEQEKQERA